VKPTSMVDTLGSVWYFDDDAKVYIRTPKMEGPRLPGPNGEDWGGPSAEPGLQDQVEHPFESWTIEDRPPRFEWHDHECCPHLIIAGPGIAAPHAQVVFTTRLPELLEEGARLTPRVGAVPEPRPDQAQAGPTQHPGAEDHPAGRSEYRNSRCR
jgi:hypothetical protein